MGHSQWVEEIWFNYLSNAVKHSGNEAPRITVGGSLVANGMVRFWVADDGGASERVDPVGLSARGEQSTFTPPKGYGLGLSIVQRIVERLGGETAVEIAEGQGSVFSFTLPAALDQAATESLPSEVVSASRDGGG
jgi:signal transduction histidine kinase